MIFTNQSNSASAVTITGTPIVPKEWAFVSLVGQYPESTQITPGAGWLILDQVDLQECVASQYLIGTSPVSISSPMSTTTGFHAIMGIFGTSIPNVGPTVWQVGGVSNLFTAGSFGFPSNVIAGHSILLNIQNSDTTQDAPITSVTISDSQGNFYTPLAAITSGAGNTQGWMYVTTGIAGGALTINYTLNHRARGGIRAVEVSGFTLTDPVAQSTTACIIC